ncbi:MAG: metallophosphoesterase [Sandaracinaceae bacterium]|nr:metallophosphoesterase [Sandaracinaceae bacterium]
MIRLHSDTHTLGLARMAAAALLGLTACEGNLAMSHHDGDVAADASRADAATLVGSDAGLEATDAAAPACEGDRSSALSLDGVDDHISMGRAPALGLSTFTIEAWVRRDGDGRTMGTGVGGLQLVPIAGKGRGEDDGSNVDCNYALGFFGDVLGADFEDMASGANHPVIGRTAVSRGVWHHVAASYDGTTWRLYLDGELDASARTGEARPRADSIQHFALGTAMNSTGAPAGRLHGALDEVRVWDHARTGAEIAASMRTTLTEADGLVAHWALDEEDRGAPDTASDLAGTITGASFVRPGAVLDRGAPPEVVVVTPMPGESVTGTSAPVRLAIVGEASEYDVRVHVRELTEDDDFAIVVLPDTQYYTTGPSAAHPDRAIHFYEDQTRWIMAERARYRIAAVIHNGDIVDDGRVASQWAVADRAMAVLEEPSDELPDGMPYALGVGNHEQREASLASYNRTFGVDRFAGRAYYGGHYDDTNNDSWIRFQANGLDFVVVNFRYDTAQDPAITAWGRRVLESHPEAFGIVNSHFIVDSSGQFGPQGQAIYDALRSVQNLQLMTCGHVADEERRSDTYGGHRIDSMLADFQGRAEGGGGFLRVWEFSPANDELTVRTYSPSHDRWETDASSEFTLHVDLSGAGGAFREVSVLRSGDDARASLEGLRPGRVYEWYATVADCAHEVATPIARLRTAP